ncbi:MAG: phosphopantothenoylcysteine decarboxylase [Kiritimatiellae bacterium]|nr:phosphopantothenoylcysteine decarboxylase [Kiritimatiellia bacterium]
MSKHILLGVTGSIAAYKAAELVRLIKGAGHEVSVVMTKAATEFVRPLTFKTLSQNDVALEMFDDSMVWDPVHIKMADKADIIVVAPCTANVLAKITHGMADDLLSATVLAAPVPVLIAPAMNDRMWGNAATQANVKTLRERGIEVMETGEGDLACGYRGSGRMPEPEDIMVAINKTLND